MVLWLHFSQHGFYFLFQQPKFSNFASDKWKTRLTSYDFRIQLLLASTNPLLYVGRPGVNGTNHEAKLWNETEGRLISNERVCCVIIRDSN
jgi:hypothetical protein